MKKYIILALASLPAFWLMAGNGMVITQQYTGSDVKAGASVTLTWYVGQSQCKMKMEYKGDKLNSTTWFIPQKANGTIQQYAEGDAPAGTQKVYYEVPGQNVKVSSSGNVGRINVQKTGEVKTIGGFNCEKMLVKTNKGNTEMWVSTDFKPDYYQFSPFFPNSLALLGLNEESIQGFPMEYTSRDNFGKVIASGTFVSGSSSNFSDADFKVPAEYKNAAEVKAAPTKK